MPDFHARKQQRTLEYQRNTGRKLITCGACAGTGIYDHTGTPPCDACDGTGRVREASPVDRPQPPHWRDILKQKTTRKTARRAIKYFGTGL